MLELAGSLATPIAGVFLYKWLHDQPGATRIFDGCMYVAIPALILWQTLPHAWPEYGFLALVALGLGIGLPTLIERFSSALARHTDPAASLIGLSGLTLHALLEGAALAPGETSIVPGIMLHRLLVGLAIWWILRPQYGFRVAALGIAAILVATVAGYATGVRLFAEGAGLDLYQVFVGGSLLHVVFHKGRHAHRHEHDCAND